jgi:aldehyde dehydrogenase (NAD+)
LQPLIGAIIAGCTAVVKHPEIAPNVAQLLADLFPKYLEFTAYAFINDGVSETTVAIEVSYLISTVDVNY